MPVIIPKRSILFQSIVYADRLGLSDNYKNRAHYNVGNAVMLVINAEFLNSMTTQICSHDAGNVGITELSPLTPNTIRSKQRKT